MPRPSKQTIVIGVIFLFVAVGLILVYYGSTLDEELEDSVTAVRVI